MNLDTNQVNQVAAVAVDVKTQVSANWPAICAAALWCRTELNNLNRWALAVAEYSIAHGGVIAFVQKFFWNPPAKVAALGQPQIKEEGK